MASSNIRGSKIVGIRLPLPALESLNQGMKLTGLSKTNYIRTAIFEKTEKEILRSGKEVKTGK